MKKTIILALTSFISFSAQAFDTRIVLDCKDARVEIFDNLGNGAPRVNDVFAIVSTKDQSQVLTHDEYSYRIGLGQATFETKKMTYTCSILSRDDFSF